MISTPLCLKLTELSHPCEGLEVALLYAGVFTREDAFGLKTLPEPSQGFVPQAD